MCVIIVKEKNQEKPKKEFLRKAWEHNPDGAGVMYVKHNTVIIRKGLMTFDEFWSVAKNLPEDTSIVYHFRIATHGARDKKGTHPFPITDKDVILQKDFIKTNVGVAHNGIIRLTSSYPKNKNVYNLSDTQLFIRDYIYKLNKLDKYWFEKSEFRDLIECALGSKMVLLTSKNKIYYFNDFVNVDGYKCSNNYFDFKPYSYYNYNYNPTNYMEVPKNDNIDFFNGEELIPIKDLPFKLEINKYNSVRYNGIYSKDYKLFENTTYIPLEYEDILGGDVL